MKTKAPLALFFAFFLASAAAALRCKAAGGGAAQPVNLRAEYRSEPLGIDAPQPRLSWELAAGRRGAAQSAYEILAASCPELLAPGRADMWETGKVASDRSIQIPYGGKPLQSRQRCWWTVRTWDEKNNASDFAAPAWWEMGLLSTNDWQAQWITMRYEELLPKPPWAQAEIPAGKWIWLPETKGKTQACFRKEFEIPQDTRALRAEILIAADDEYTLYVNGEKIGAGNEPGFFDRYNVTARIRPGWNALAIRATNEKGPCGLYVGAILQHVKTKSRDFAPEEVKTLALSSDRNAPQAPSLGGESEIRVSPWLVADEPEDGWTEAEFDTGWLDEDKGSLYVKGNEAAWTLPLVIAQPGEPPWKGTKERVSRMRRSLLFRKEFQTSGETTRARVYASGLGIYELYINGSRVSEDIFAPGWTFYPKRIQYQTYDVTSMLRQGANAIAGWVGSGWWNGMDGSGGEPPRLFLQLEIENASGERQTIATDESWLCSPSPVLRDSFYHGETYDARLETPGWNEPGAAAGEWTSALVLKSPLESYIAMGLPGTPKITVSPWPHPAAGLIAQQAEPIRCAEELQAKRFSSPAAGVFIFDFGQNAAGRCRLTVKNAQPGAAITLRHSEVLRQDGSLYTDNYRSARVTDTYICKGAPEETWEPRFTYRGFQYAELKGYPGEPPPDALIFRVIHTAAPAAGRFECSDALLNRIHANVNWSLRSNMYAVFTDCPQRDERMGWLDVVSECSPTACWNWDMSLFLAKIVRDIIHSPGDYATGGLVQGHGPGWADAIISAPWALYRFYGDTRILEESYETMAAFVEKRTTKAVAHMLPADGYGDWIAPGDWKEMVEKPRDLIANAYYYRSAALLAQMAAVIGKTEESKRYAELAANIAKAFNRKYLDCDANIYALGLQTTQVLPLSFGIVPADRYEAVAWNLVENIKKHDFHLATGFLGTAYLLPALTAAGYPETAYKVAQQTTYPSWGYMVEQGATTIWELWDSDKQGPNMNSRNHPNLGAVGEWLFETVAGLSIAPAAPAFKRIIIRPRPGGGLTWAKAEYKSMHGLVRASWRMEPDSFLLETAVPPNTTAEVYLPAAEHAEITENGVPAGAAEGVLNTRRENGFCVIETGSGEYRFAVRPAPPPPVQ